MLTESSLLPATNKTILPPDFYSRIQARYGNELFMTPEGVALAKENDFFKNLYSAMIQMDTKIDNAVAAEIILGRTYSHEQILHRDNIATSQGLNMQFLERRNNSWSFLLELADDDNKYMIKVPANHLNPPLRTLSSREHAAPSINYQTEMQLTQVLGDLFTDQLNAANVILPQHLMAASFFSIVKYEGNQPISPSIYDLVLVPLGLSLNQQIRAREASGETIWDKVLLSWAHGYPNSFRQRPDGKFACVEPFTFVG